VVLAACEEDACEEDEAEEDEAEEDELDDALAPPEPARAPEPPVPLDV